ESFGVEIERLRKQKEDVKDKMSKMANSSSSSELERLEHGRAAKREELIKNESHMSGIDMQVGMYAAEKDKALAIMASNNKDWDTFSAELSELDSHLIGKRGQLKEKEMSQRKFYSEYQHMFATKEKLSKRVQQIELVAIQKEERIRGVEGRGNDVSVKIALMNGELEGLNKEFLEYKDVQLRRGVSLEDLNGEIKAFEQSMRGMGNVNLRALEIYEKVRTEYDELTKKYETLKLEKEDVLKMMYEIETNKKGIFMKTFDGVNDNFKEIFSSLSTKCEALLVVENPDYPFGAGIVFEVRIVGNKFLDIKSLSGGEKTMAALAFIFAIQDFEPAHFYVMDEVDAALDKKNSELLSKLIAKYAANSQYIVISHNESIITEADTIYGVSMQEGVSKVVSLRI
ncbi:MAG: hypothetical protein AABY09_00470, partial [Nanoarchaeota archaeon]